MVNLLADSQHKSILPLYIKRAKWLHHIASLSICNNQYSIIGFSIFNCFIYFDTFLFFLVLVFYFTMAMILPLQINIICYSIICDCIPNLQYLAFEGWYNHPSIIFVEFIYTKDTYVYNKVNGVTNFIYKYIIWFIYYK
jgi:hypothetical protein